MRETAARLGVSPWLIEKAIRERTLASVKLGDRRLIPVDAVEELLAQAYVRNPVAPEASETPTASNTGPSRA